MIRETSMGELAERWGEDFLKTKADWLNSSKVICTFGSTPPPYNWVNRSTIVFVGDSGSPLVQYNNNRGYAIGVAVSTFAGINLPIAVYTSVSNNIDFIHDVLAGKIDGYKGDY